MNFLRALVCLLALASPAFAQNPYYDHGSYPEDGAQGSAARMRAELDLIEAGFAKLPAFTSNANKAVIVNGSQTGLTTTTGTLTLPGNFALSGTSSVTLTSTGTTNVTLPTSGTLSTTATDIPVLDTFPASPTVDDLVVIITASAPGECDDQAGIYRTICIYDGSFWQPVSSAGSGSGSDTLDNVTARGNTSTGNDETNPFEIFGTGGQNIYGWIIDRTSLGESRIRCKEAAGVNKCNYYRQIDDTFEGGFMDKDSTKRLTVNGTTGVITNVTLDMEGTGNNITFYRKLCGGNLVGVDPATGTGMHLFDKDQLSTALTATVVTGTNQTFGTARFTDADGDQGVVLRCPLLTAHTGQVDFQAWGKTAGTGNFRLQIATACYASGEASDAAYNTASVYTLAAGTANRQVRYTGTNITMTGCAANETAFFRIFRNRTEASDTLNNAFDLSDFEIWVRNIN